VQLILGATVATIEPGARLTFNIAGRTNAITGARIELK
jgi:hypothetical protein